MSCSCAFYCRSHIGELVFPSTFKWKLFLLVHVNNRTFPKHDVGQALAKTFLCTTVWCCEDSDFILMLGEGCCLPAEVSPRFYLWTSVISPRFYLWKEKTAALVIWNGFVKLSGIRNVGEWGTLSLPVPTYLRNQSCFRAKEIWSSKGMGMGGKAGELPALNHDFEPEKLFWGCFQKTFIDPFSTLQLRLYLQILLSR